MTGVCREKIMLWKSVHFKSTRSSEHARQRPSHIPKVFSLLRLANCHPTYRSTQVDKTVSLLHLLPVQVYFVLFPSRSDPIYISSFFSNLTLCPWLLNTSFQSICCSLRSASPSAATANHLRAIGFGERFLYISSYDIQQWAQGAPCVRPTFTLNSPDTHGPHSTKLFVSSTSPPPYWPPPLELPSTSGLPLLFLVGLWIYKWVYESTCCTSRLLFSLPFPFHPSLFLSLSPPSHAKRIWFRYAPSIIIGFPCHSLCFRLLP